MVGLPPSLSSAAFLYGDPGRSTGVATLLNPGGGGGVAFRSKKVPSSLAEALLGAPSLGTFMVEDITGTSHEPSDVNDEDDSGVGAEPTLRLPLLAGSRPLPSPLVVVPKMKELGSAAALAA